jgi:hypothetical protein
MSDDLVKRLRDEVILERFEGGHVSQMRNQDGPEAADRIEKLEAALQFYACGCTVRCADFEKNSGCGYTARKALDAK